MNAFRIFIMVGMAASMTVSVAACGGAPEDFELAEQEAELGEAGCATVSGTPYSGKSTHGSSATPSSCGTTQHFRSPDSSYNNGSTCSDQYIAEVRNIQGRKLTGMGMWRHDLIPLDKYTCSKAKIKVGTYMRNSSTGLWDVHTTTYSGQWLGGVYGCVVIPDSGQSWVTLNGTEGYDTIRFAARATFSYVTGSGSIEVKVPVGVDVIYPPSPC